MSHLHFIVEGSTEETFVKRTLVTHFAALHIWVSCERITTNYRKGAKGGLMRFEHLKSSVERYHKANINRSDLWITSMVDLYAFPKGKNSPFSEDIRKIVDAQSRVSKLEESMTKLIDCPRFIPYVQLYEFETLLLVDLNRLSTFFPGEEKKMQALTRQLEGKNLENVNGGVNTAPSKRIIKQLPAYEDLKNQIGPDVAHDIGLPKLRAVLPHFNTWVTRLENITS